MDFLNPYRDSAPHENITWMTSPPPAEISHNGAGAEYGHPTSASTLYTMEDMILLGSSTAHENFEPMTPPSLRNASRSLMSYPASNIPQANLSELTHPVISAGRGTVLHSQAPMTPSTLPTLPPRLQTDSKPNWTQLRLPMTLHTNDSSATVLACADTGADVNVISEELANTLGYTDYKSSSEKNQFILANGKLVGAVGQIQATCSFGVEAEVSRLMTCLFYVFSKAATPIIMGVDFLEQTKTMTEHRSRLVRVPRPAFPAFPVYSIGRAKRLLTCELDHVEVLATADSGSEIDLISPSFAAKRGLSVHPGKKVIQFADGSIAFTAGCVIAHVSLVSDHFVDRYSHRKRSAAVEIFLLEGLTHDLVVGENLLEELQVFTNHQDALVYVSHGSERLSIDRIRLLGAIDRLTRWIKKRMRTTDSTNGNNAENFEHRDSSLRDQRENDRREREFARIAALPAGEQHAAIEAEVEQQRLYLNTSALTAEACRSNNG